MDVVDDDYSDPGHVFRYFSRFVPDPETDHLVPEIRMLRLYVHGRRAFLERRWHPEHGVSPWTVVCPELDISEREVSAVWKARTVAVKAEVRLGRPERPAPGSDVERWLKVVETIGEEAARARYKATVPRQPGRAKWWQDNIRRTLRRRKQRQK